MAGAGAICPHGGFVRVLTVEQLEALRRIDSPTVSNAIEHFGVRSRVEGYAGWDLRCAIPELGTMLGYAKRTPLSEQLRRGIAESVEFSVGEPVECRPIRPPI